MAGVRCAHAARALGAVEGQGVRAKVFTPKYLFEAIAKGAGLLLEVVGLPRTADDTRHLGGDALRRIDVALNLAQRDRALGEMAVGMKDGIVRVFPALVSQARRGAPAIFDETVAVA